VELAAIYEALRSLWVVWLTALFLGICAWALWPRNKARFEAAGLIPLRDDDQE
jgi:cytochrome c oxidase cbb3-type subunit 4